MTDREKQLIIGVLTKVFTCSLDGSKNLDEHCEDFVNLGKKIIDIVNKMNTEEKDTITEEIKFHENKIKDIQHEMYVQQIFHTIPQVNNIYTFNT